MKGWENPALVAINREAHRAFTVSYENVETALMSREHAVLGLLFLWTESEEMLRNTGRTVQIRNAFQTISQWRTKRQLSLI